MNAVLQAPARTWSPYQEAIFAHVADPLAGNAIVEAVAGSGKTTTIVEAMSRIPAGASAIFLAFNKSIAEELKSRGVNARTFHSLTYSPVTRARKVRNIDTNRTRGLIDARMGEDYARIYGSFVSRLVSLAKQAGLGTSVAELNEDTLQALVDHHDLELDSDSADPSKAIQLAFDVFCACQLAPGADFDDLLYFAVYDELPLSKFDYVFVDEAQDTNAIQRAILRKIMHKDSRIVAVGDPAQAIYGFRGADSNSLDLIAQEFNCKRLPLTVSYRCPRNVVEFARQWVKHIEPAPTAPEGVVNSAGDKWDVKGFKAGDLVTCRTTRPVIGLAYKLLKERIPAQVLGREIGAGLIALVKKLNAKGVDNLIVKLNAWRDREARKAEEKKQDAKAQAIHDKADAILCLIDSMPETERTVPALIATIDNLFADKRGAVILSTIHKAKGLEAERVFWLNASACPAKWARQDWQKQQEVNLCYVAATRAKVELVLIEEQVRAA